MKKQFTLTKWVLGLLMVLFTFAGTAQNLSEGFEGTTFPPNGWSVINGGDAANTWVRYTTTPYNGLACAAISYGSTAHNDWLITPQLRPTAGNSTISFWSKNYSATYIEEFNVKVSTTGNNEADFTITLASNVAPGLTYTQYTYDLSAYIGQDVYFAIQSISTDEFRLFVDDFAGPGLTPPPLPGVAVIGSPANGALGLSIASTLNWTAPVTGGTPAGYRVYFGTDNPPTNIANGVDVGNVLSYDPNPDLAYATQYYWQIVPYNVTGSAVGAPVWSFATSLGTGALEGFVTNGFGIPLGGVSVNIVKGIDNFTTTTAANGSYSFGLISAGPYTMTATLATYNTTILPNVMVEPNITNYQNVVMTRPSMAVTPNPYSLSLNPNEMVDGAINIANNGDGVLGWNATINYTSPGPNTWLTLVQSTGTVNAYSNFNAPVAFNATGLTAGTIKTAEITFTSTPNVGTVVVPVTMTVAGAPLNVPTDLTATLSNPIDGTVNLAWSFTPGPGFQNFIIKRNGIQVGTTINTTFTNTLPAYGVYSYTVQAVTADGNSAPAGPVEIEWSNPTMVISPTSLYDEVWVNTQAVQFLTINNTGEGTLAYSFPAWVGGGEPQAYCEASGGCDEYIGTVSFANLSNTSNCSEYSDYTSLAADVTPGQTYTMTITNPNAYSSDIAGVWIDFNQDGDFEDGGEYFTTTMAGSGATFTRAITIPADVETGSTRMRVRLQYGGTLAPCGETSFGEVEDYTLNIGGGNFITAVTPASGTVAPGQAKIISITYDATDFAPGQSYFEDLELESNDLANASVTIENEMFVYQPGMLTGTVTSAVDGSPIAGAVVTAGTYNTTTNVDGIYNFMIDAGTYNMTFSKTGFTTETVTGVVVTETQTTTVNAELEEVLYPVTLVHAEVNETDTQTEVTWGVPEPDYEVLYDDGTAENYTAWALPGNMNAVKFTPAGYPAAIYGGKIYVGDGSFPNNNTGFIGTTFGAVVIDDDGANGLPGTVLDSIEVTVDSYGWVSFTGLNATIEDGSFYLGMVQGGISPNVAPIGIDQQNPVVYRSYSRNVVAGQPWGLSPYQDMMIRAFVNGPANTDVQKLSAEVRGAVKQRGMISLLPATAQSGAEGEGLFLAIQDGQISRDVTGYKVWRVAVANPDAGAQSGVQTLLNGNVSTTSYTDAAFGPLPEGWYAYAVAANYTNGGESPKAFSNIVGHKKLVNVTFNVSLTTGGSPVGAVISLTGNDYPYATWTQTVPENGTVVFEDVWKGNYSILAAKVGFDDYAFNANIQSNRTFDIILAERKYMPRNLYVDPLTLVATWDEPLAISVMEDFEGATFPPAGWQALTQNTTGWYATTNGSSSSWTIPAHTKYAVTNDDADNGDGCCDYLITPEMDWTDLPSYRLNFASFYDGTYMQSAYIEISTDAGATWTVVNTLAPAPGAWQNLEIDLAAYSGAAGLSSVWLAFHGDDNGEWSSGWAIDDVQIASGGVPHQGYGVFLDGTLVGNTPETTWQYTNLNYGQTYTAGVAALFTSGYSELDTYRFTSVYLVPPTDLAGVSPDETDYVHLTWVEPTVTATAANTDNLTVVVAQPAADRSNAVNARSFPQTNIPLASSRDILFDNGPLVNSPGTGSGGADESILQGDLGMTTYGSGMQQSAGNSVADDFTVTGTWTLENFEFFGYQTGSTTTSTMTGIYYRIWDGDPTAGGTVIYGDLTTNKMISTEWANMYRNDNGPGGSTDRPVMRMVADASGITLTEGTYWVEWTAAGTLSSGPWVPAVTIEGQTTTGNAIQNQAGTWVALTDVGPQGMPFIVNGNSGGQSVANLMGYNVYRDEALVAYVEKPTTEYFDLDLEPGTYTYHITAVYDLTPYGFAGQTGESMIEGPIDVEVKYGFDLPFFEDWTTGLFETNEWSAEGTNWQIAGQAGNPAPSVQFTYSPIQTEYSLSLESAYINGTGFVDGKIFLDFDLKLDDNNATGEETLKVEVYNGSAWVTVNTITAEGDMNWEGKHIDITNSAKNRVFRIRFTAEGMNTLDINNWQIDNIHIYRLCEAPTELIVSLPDPANHGDQIKIEWTGISGSGPGVEDWLFWDNGTNDDAIGLTGGGTFSVAARFTPEQLAAYAGTSLTKLRIFPYQDGGSIVLKVWTGANAGNLVLQQPVASYNGGVWNEFALNTPVAVTGTTELWIGYTVTHPDQVYIAGCDAGPAVAGYGDLLSTDGSVWESMATAYGLNYNWNLQGWVETLDGVTTPLVPQADLSTYSSTGNVVAGNLPQLPGATVAADANKGVNEFVGYNVYRSGEGIESTLIATTTETFYLDTDPSISILGSEWCYTVTAQYEDCESEHLGPECETVVNAENLEISAVNVYPNPSNDVVNIDLTSDIAQIVVYNYSGQVVHEQIIAKDKNIQLNVRNYDAGAYLIKFVTRSGESFAKKLTVTK